MQLNQITYNILLNLEQSEGSNPLNKLLNLPKNDSLVEVFVLRKEVDNYKVLIEGKVFLTKLPVNAANGETLVGKVIKINPFTISLDNLTGNKEITEQTIGMIINKIGLLRSENSNRIVKNLLIAKKPLIKSKIEKLSEYLEENHISDELLNLLILLITDKDWEENLSDKNLPAIFNDGLNKIMYEIFSLVIEIHKDYRYEFPELKNRIIYNDPEEFRGSLNYYELFEKLNESIKINSNNHFLVQRLELLRIAIIKMFFQKRYYSRINRNPEFIIIKKDNEFELIKFLLERNKDKDENYYLSLSMSPDNLGEVLVEAVYNDERLNVTFMNNNMDIKIHNDEREYLINSVQTKFRIITNVWINKLRSSIDLLNNNTISTFQSVNAKA